MIEGDNLMGEEECCQEGHDCHWRESRGYLGEV